MQRPRRARRRCSAVAVVLQVVAAHGAAARRPRAPHGGLLSLAPAAFALRGGELAAYHGAEHISIGTYEHGESRPKEHERCGSHLVGPMLADDRARQPPRRAGAGQAAPGARSSPRRRRVAASTEIFGWMTRNPSHPRRARAREAGPRAAAPARDARADRRRSSRSPRPRCAACLELESMITTRTRLDPAIFDLPVEKMRAGWYTDAYFNHTRATLLRGRPPPARRACRSSRRSTRTSAAWTRRSRSSSSARTTSTR